MLSRRSLFRQVIAVNVAVFLAASLALALSPATVSSPLTAGEAVTLAIGSAVAIAANALLVRRAFSPLLRLNDLTDRVDLLEAGETIDPRAVPPEVARLVLALNSMLRRLEDERYASNRRTLAAQEAERRRIARELHDELGQNLTALLVHVARAERLVPDEVRPDLKAAHHAARANLDEVQRIVQQLRPQALEDLGLVSALESLTEAAAARSGLDISLRTRGAFDGVADDVELTLYRITQEALTNIARHADAATVRIELGATDGTVQLTIEDDGVGIENRVEERSGLRGMGERARIIGGTLEVSRRPGGGVQVSVRAPLLPTDGASA